MVLLVIAACGGDDAAVAPDASGIRTWSLDAPESGEWPTFHRSNRREGRAEGEGAITGASVCERFAYEATIAGTRANSGVLIGEVGGTWMALGVVESCASGEESCTRDGATYRGGFVFAVDGDGREVFHEELPDEAQSDVYAPTLADVDADGRRELVMASNDEPVVFAVRTEDEPDGAAGTVQWTFRYDDDLPVGQSEGAPAVAQLDDDDALEVVLGTDSNQAGVPARVYVIDGATGDRDAEPFVADDRHLADDGCTSVNKIDSSSPAIAEVDGEVRVYVGAWDGAFRALAVRDGALVTAWTHALPAYPFECGVAKVRSGAVLADLVPGGAPEIAFGMMGDAEPEPDRFDTAIVRVLDAATGELVGELDTPDWKSSPAAADGRIYAGRWRGYYAATATDVAWDTDWGDGNPYGANRSSPALADIDGDGALEIVVGTEGDIVDGAGRRGLTVLDAASGDVEWTWPADGVAERPGVASSPAVGDVDGDGALEIVFLGTDGVIHALDSECP